VSAAVEVTSVLYYTCAALHFIVTVPSTTITAYNTTCDTPRCDLRTMVVYVLNTRGKRDPKVRFFKKFGADQVLMFFILLFLPPTSPTPAAPLCVCECDYVSDNSMLRSGIVVVIAVIVGREASRYDH
jgi:hypothetical protein